MSSKEFLKKIAIGSLIVPIFLYLITTIIIDPYREFEISNAPWNKHRYVTAPQTAAYQAMSRLQTTPYTLIFGSSRSSTISSKELGTNVLNLSLVIYAYPQDINAFLSQLSPKEWKNVKAVLYNVDFMMKDGGSIFENMSPNRKWGILKSSIQNMNRQKMYRAAEVIIKNIAQTGTAKLSRNWEFQYQGPVAYTRKKEAFSIISEQKSLDALGEINRRLEEKQIPVQYFLPVFHDDFLAQVNHNALEHYLEKILTQVPTLISLINIPTLSNQTKYFQDMTHHTHEITAKEIEILSSPEKRMRYELTKEIITTYINQLDIEPGLN